MGEIQRLLGEPLGQVITLCGQILVSRTGDDPRPSHLPSLSCRVYVQNVPVCTPTRPASQQHEGSAGPFLSMGSAKTIPVRQHQCRISAKISLINAPVF